MESEHIYLLIAFCTIAALVAGFLVWYGKFTDTAKRQAKGYDRRETNGYLTESEVKNMLTAWCGNCTVTNAICKRIEAIEVLMKQAGADNIRDKADIASEKLRVKAEEVKEMKEMADKVEVNKKERNIELENVSEKISKIAEAIAMLAFGVKNKAQKESILKEMISLQRGLK
jgi:hypothetical protein